MKELDKIIDIIQTYEFVNNMQVHTIWEIKDFLFKRIGLK